MLVLESICKTYVECKLNYSVVPVSYKDKHKMNKKQVYSMSIFAWSYIWLVTAAQDF